MALLEIEGFDNTHTVAGWVDGFDDATLMSNFSTTETRSTGGASAAVNDSNVGSRHPMRNFGATHGGKAEFGFGVALKHSGGTAQGACVLVRLREGATTHMTVNVNASGQLEIRNSAGTILATSTLGTPFTLTGVWQEIGVEVKINDTTGYVKVYMNGSVTPVVQWTGDTRNAATGVVDRVAMVQSSTFAANTIRVDDWYLYDMLDGTALQGAPNNSYADFGDCRVELERPNGNGASSGFLGSDGNSIDNYLLVDDAGVTTDYVGASVTGTRDLYTMTDLTAPGAGLAIEVIAVQVEAMVAKSDAGAVPNLLAVFRDADGTIDTDVLAAAAGITTSYQWFRGPLVYKDPDLIDWTYATANALQVGVEIG